MYLSRKTYVKNWDHMTPEERTEISVSRGGKPLPGIDVKNISYIEEEVGYWRKANQIHLWFTDNCADGVDECQTVWIDPEKLKELYEICVKIKNEVIMGEDDIENGYTFKKNEEGKAVKVPLMEKGLIMVNPQIAEELLPTQSGFFFGSTNYDQWYMRDIELTIEILKPLVEQEAQKGLSQEYYYRASW